MYTNGSALSTQMSELLYNSSEIYVANSNFDCIIIIDYYFWENIMKALVAIKKDKTFRKNHKDIWEP